MNLIRRINFSVIKRPLCFTLAGFLLTYFLCGFFHSSLKITVAAIILYIGALMPVIGVVLRRRGHEFYAMPYTLAALAIALAFILSFINFDLKLEKLEKKYDSLAANVTLTVISANTVNENYSSHEVLLREINGEKCRIKAFMTSTYMNPFESGESLKLPVKISVDNRFSNLSEAYGFSKGYFLNVISENEEALEIVDDGSAFPYSQTARLRNGVSRLIRKFTRDEGTSLSGALVYGDRSGLSRSFTDSFRELGISHMLAISGMHFSIIVGLLAAFLCRLPLNKKISLLLLGIFVLFYALISGFSASVSRAAIMLLLSYASFYFGRRSDAVSSLFCSAFIICMLSPYAIYDLGLLLSFFSTLGILTVAVPINEGLRSKSIYKIRPLYLLVSALNITLAAVLFTLPISYFCFGEMSYVSPISNLIFSVFITLILYLIPFMLILSPIIPIAKMLGGAITFISKICVSLSSFLSGLGSFTVRFDGIFSDLLFALTVLSLVLMLLFLKSFSKRRYLAYVPLIAFVAMSCIGNAIITYPYLHGGSVAYYTENENDAIIISSGKEVLLCDISSGNYPFTKNAIEYGEKLCRNKVSAYMISDYHYTHIATVTRLVESTDIRTFILPKPQERDLEFHNAIKTFLDISGCDVRIYTPCEEKLNFGKISLTPYIYPHKTANPASIIVIESEISDLPRYTYFSNTGALTLTSSEFSKSFTSAVKKADVIIYGSHGNSEKALDTAVKVSSAEIVRSQFYSGIKN
ncbi:MAG: ComEC/Rec2 family competence protein [Ruminococcaceae bacterium]|nr:ComEC/Rec2 family competence protein [Oscillospiraceae bacterium]